MADPRTTQVIQVIDSQSGKTAATHNVALWCIDDLGLPALYLGPTRSNVAGVISPKLDAILRGNPELWARVAKGKRLSAAKKTIDGVTLRLAWGGHSTTETKSDSAFVCIVDEADEFGDDIGGQGSIWVLANARVSAYTDGTVLGVSTPTEGKIETFVHPETGITHWKIAEAEHVASAIWRAWQGGSRHEAAAPCIDCGAYFVPRSALCWWPEDTESEEDAEERGRVICPHCGTMIHGRHRAAMRSRLVYIAPGQKPKDYEAGDECALVRDADGSEHAVEFGGYFWPGDRPFKLTLWSSGLLSFNVRKTWGRLIGALWAGRSSGDPETIKGVMNTVYGECWAFSGISTTVDEIRAHCCAAYAEGQVPAELRQRAESGRILLTMGVDVQAAMLYYVVRGWAAGLRSWLLERGTLLGETDQPEVWEQLSGVVSATWGGLPVARCAIDAGFRSNSVYAFCRGHPVIAQAWIGKLRSEKPYWSSRIDVTVDGKLVEGGQELWKQDTDVSKSWVHSRLKREQMAREGAWFLPQDIPTEYLQQLLGEYRDDATGAWIAVGPNHYLDCEALAYMAIRSLGARERAIGAPPASGGERLAGDAGYSDRAQPAPTPQAAKRRRRRGQLGRGVQL